MGKSLAQYRQEAKAGSFELAVDDNTTIVIPPPDSDTFLDLGTIPMNEPRRLLEKLCGEKYEEVMGVLGKEPVPVLIAVLKDMFAEFGITDLGQGVGGPLA